MKNTVLIFFSVLLMVVTDTQAQPAKQVKQMADADSARLAELFRDLHQHPELAFMEERTSGIVASGFKALGYEVITGIGKTGVVGILKNGNGPVVMYRADMDCNAVKEITGLSYSSTKTMFNSEGIEVPVMHACGHDAHITWMLGAAKIMAALKKEWKGTLVFVAQPAEEIGAGAKAMLQDSMYNKGVPVPDFLLGMHTVPLPVGKVDNAFGERMAGTDQIDVTFYGIGGHGASPEFTKDPIVMASNAVLQYQTIVSRNIAAQEVAVLTVGAFKAGNSNNVIPSSAVLKLNLRWFNDKTRNTLIEGIKHINEGIAIANHLPADMYPTVEIKTTAAPLVNDKAMSGKINKALAALLPGQDIITDRPALMVSEDFHYLVYENKKAVYDFIFVGIANPEAVAKANKDGRQYPFFNHSGDFQVDLSAIPLGAAIGSTALLEIFRK
ncbi:MAG: amidohydrolase [Sphingobacteriales bacterium 40-81]|nr:MAG: amidohydrolase [Sphingobacteriales bacterium 40-81]